MKTRMLLAVVGILWCGQAIPAETQETGQLSSDAYYALVEKVGEEFQALKGRNIYRLKVLKPRTAFRYDNGSSQVVLEGEARAFAERYSLHDLAAGLWSFLDDPNHAANACGILYAKTGKIFMGASGKMYMDKPETCKVIVRSALNQPDWWYPHPIFFDRDRVLAESRTNAAARAAHIEAMVKALADPKIRSENPLEVKNVLGILSALNATEAVATFVQYAFFDRSTGADFRRQSANTNDFSDVHGLTLPIVTLIPRLGTHALPLVLERFANATPDETSVRRGGGGLPVLAVMYFIGCGYSERAAIEAIDTFLRGRGGLSDTQVGTLLDIQNVISAKLYRPAWLREVSTRSYQEWAAPVVTNNATSD